MFKKEEIRAFIIKGGKKWLFPDFTNKLTWGVVTIGATILLTPTPLKEIFYNWLVDTFNLNSGEYFTLAELQTSSSGNIIGLLLILAALLHNLVNRYLIYKTNSLQNVEKEALEAVDLSLFKQLLTDLPSNSQCVLLLKEHNFGASYHKNHIEMLDDFADSWNTAEKEFLDPELEAKRKDLWEKCNQFSYDLAVGSYALNGSRTFSCIPDSFRHDFNLPDHVTEKLQKLNEMARECYQAHKEMVLLGRRKLKC